MHRNVVTKLTALSLAAFAVGACAKDPTEGKTVATVSEARQPEAAAEAKQPTAETEKAAPGAKAVAVETLDVDVAASKVGFVGAKVTAQHVGEFKEFTGKVTLADGKLSAVEFEVKPASVVVDGGMPKLEGHLRHEDFFFVEKYPTARFVSTEIKGGSDVEGMNATVTGNLELRGVTRSITFPAYVEVTESGVTAKTEFGINRKDFGIEYPGMQDDLIKDNVLLQIAFQAKRSGTTTAAAE